MDTACTIAGNRSKDIMTDEEALALYDRMHVLANRRYQAERNKLAQKFGLVTDRCPRCTQPLQFNDFIDTRGDKQTRCYCNACLWDWNVNGGEA